MKKSTMKKLIEVVAKFLAWIAVTTVFLFFSKDISRYLTEILLYGDLTGSESHFLSHSLLELGIIATKWLVFLKVLCLVGDGVQHCIRKYLGTS